MAGALRSRWLLPVFVLAHGTLAFLAMRPDLYSPGSPVDGDLSVYGNWTEGASHPGLDLYEEVPVEYPPAAVAVAVAPSLLGPLSYRAAFVLVMVLVDAAAFAGLVARARRTGSAAGAWFWIAALALLGPIVFLRLDLVPAAASIWALEALARGRRWASGALAGIAIAVKLYPVAFLPWLGSGRRREIPVAALAVFAATLLPFALHLGDVWTDVVGFHSGRGVHLESTWGGLLLAASAFGHPATASYEFTSLQVGSPAAPTLEALSFVALVAILVAGSWIGWRRAGSGDERAIAGCVAVLAIVLFVAPVFSPQFMLWLAAPTACLSFAGGRALRLAGALVLAACALSQAIYPFFYGHLVIGAPPAVALLLVRNASVAAAGVLVAGTVLKGKPES